MPHIQSVPHDCLTHASQWVARFASLVKEGGHVLDLACGRGRHTELFLALGHPVTAVDIDVSEVEKLGEAPGLTILQADLENGPWPLEGRRFDAVVVTNYLWRTLFPKIIDSLAPGGVLIYETFAEGHERHGRPSRPEHLLKPGELLEAVRGRLEVRAFEHGEELTPKPTVRQKICAVRVD